ncbi:MAG: hypothetical protein EOM20_05430 [Spartobacteria bacterium]|nr:hypothetical protein [Spartobacteria bacterium]
MMIRKFVMVAMAVLAAGSIYGEAMRPLLTKENAFPGKHRFEVGAVGQYKQLNKKELAKDQETDVWWGTPYGRFGVADNFALFAKVPYGSIRPETGSDESGIGDVSAGFELLAFEDIFTYPFVIPHAEVFFNTGDEDKGLGEGKTHFMGGIAVGTVVEEVVQFVADLRYEIYDNRDNVASLAISVIWDLSERFAVLGEMKAADEEVNNHSYTMFFQGGLCYKITEALAINVYGGAGKHTDEDVVASTKISYAF